MTVQLRLGLRQLLVATLAMPEQVLYHMGHLLDIRVDARLGLLLLLDQLPPRIDLVRFL